MFWVNLLIAQCKLNDIALKSAPQKDRQTPNKFDGQFDDPHHIKACFKKGPGDFSPEPFCFLNE